ncbi:Nramp family divalent metal transporter [Solitalea canadensis]|uniref:Divalent metal cation transporter MntH n=1 Tax=Solitalea canadensis (strain ATCC 29591 / DSM 3403 / JCM 21819 / LMG 8368 / NBRC 15130 / NCIMB 12057 / USAM 9D) TaxID=929556 RepID=H8KRP1_SOLCM|nr:Nramp family divalent metal transporter [Solitalea canadensis]AFD07622.1 natural resistance-associated macrophage protein metal ion transporter NRAMP [Solitalea canadensis DSM 3403]
MSQAHSSGSLAEVHSSVSIPVSKSPWKRFMAFIGPAYLVSVGYMDPGNWATDIAGGSKFGYQLIWVLLMSNLMALLLQSLSARLGIVRGLDLAQASRKTYPSFINIPLYILAEIAIAACDLAEVIGMAIGLKLLFGLPLIWGVSITVLDTLIILFLMNKGIRTMEVFIVSMVFIIGMAFLVDVFIAQPDVKEIARGFKPSILGGEALYIAIGIIGATVMPHNLYLHSSLVQTRKIENEQRSLKEALKFNFFDTTIALNLAFLVNASILILAAAAFHNNGYFEIADIEDAHELLTSIFGSLAPALFAVALIASGQSSTITGTLAGQIVMEGYLNLRIRPWLRRLITRIIAIAPAMITIIWFGEDKLGELLVLSQVVLSLQLGFAIIPLIHFCSDKSQMNGFAIKNWVKVLAWISATLIISLNVKLVYEEITGWLVSAGDNVIYIYILVLPVTILTGCLLLYVIVVPFIRRKSPKDDFVPHGTALSIDSPDFIEYKNIAITIDFSAMDRHTIRNALVQGGKDADYTLIHIVESAGAQYLGQSINDFETRSDERNIDKYVSEIKKMGYKVEGKIGYGNPAKAIAKIVNNSEIDFLVMGAHGHKALKDVIFGATVDTVRHKVKVPVLIVKDNQ